MMKGRPICSERLQIANALLCDREPDLMGLLLMWQDELALVVQMVGDTCRCGCERSHLLLTQLGRHRIDVCRMPCMTSFWSHGARNR